ncbi:class I SAM-dependent methyltransferase [Fontisubflavum oceani]|uniref:class I SAM-dependent methyltransferase n=1 Tax=Fontisubflavum oceani TaxID=2978973 RepID=UPI0025B404A3|nr:class I SAM-dependent methyltransferase [Fontisubflavum oceani]WJY21191.1 class I SAM-dependent methyltransferase [Fontisubflavum oceani]
MAALLTRLKTRRERKRRRTQLEPGFRRMTGRHYHDVLIEIERRVEPQWYVEIGSRSDTSIAHRKCNFVAIDPVLRIEADVFNDARELHFMQQTSDDFFASGFLGKLGIVPDFAFIDGMHKFEFALRDFMNLEAVMEPGGLIAMHDVCPYDYAMAERDPAPGTTPFAWTGDVWKTVLVLKELRPDLRIDVLNAASTGLACIRNLDPANRGLLERYDEVVPGISTFL